MSKVLKRVGKWSCWMLVSLVLTHTFLAYFMPIRELLAATVSPPSQHPTAFTFIVVTTLVIYFNFASFREQLCIVICPYGRLQSVLYDKDTVQVAYDHVRGEPRGKFKDEGRGACVDCSHCVAACPTGIDIRNGTQLECVGCANCIDACDAVMEKIGQEPGLVRLASLTEIEGGKRRVLRPRLFVYFAVFTVLMSVFAFVLTQRKDFEAKLLRQAGSPIQKIETGVQNSLFVHVVNKKADKRSFAIDVRTPEGAEVVLALREVELDGFADARVPVFVRFDPNTVRSDARVHVVVTAEQEKRELELGLLGGKAK